MKFRVLSDSSCDITKEQEERYHIGIIPYYVSMDGVHYKKDRVEITAEEFYREMAENPGVYPKTSTPTQVDLYHFFLPYAKRLYMDSLCSHHAEIQYLYLMYSVYNVIILPFHSWKKKREPFTALFHIDFLIHLSY